MGLKLKYVLEVALHWEGAEVCPKDGKCLRFRV